MTNTAIWADENGQITSTHLPTPQPAPGEMLIQVLYSGVNPSDIRSVRFSNCRRRVLGNEFCGRVIECPADPASSQFKVGDIVAGYTGGMVGRPLRWGTHQSCISVPPANSVFRVPDNLPQADAAALTVVVQTANDALFNRFRLPLPGTASTEAGTLVIWGGATSVGMATIQLARASGVASIIVTASAQRHGLLKTLGATRCFDYKDEDVEEKVKAAVEEAGPGPIWGLDAAGAPGSQTLLVKALPDREDIHLATVLPLLEDERFEITLGARHYDMGFDIPGQEAFVLPARPDEADRMWKALMWVVEHYGDGYRAPPVRVFRGTAEEAMQEIVAVGDMSVFGKLVLEHPLQ